MAVKLNAKEQEYALSWMHDVLIAGGLKDSTGVKRHGYRQITNQVWGNQRAIVQKACKTVCDEILNRQFADIDSAFKELSDAPFCGSFKSNRTVKRSPEHLAAFVAWFCANNGIYWDNTLRTTYEMDVFEKTLLGDALKQYDGYVEPIVVAKKATSTKTATQKAPGQGPKNDYKSTGGQSGNVRDLKGTAGTKEILSVPMVFVIKGVNANTAKVPYAFIRPLKASGASGNTNKVFLGDPSGYTDCTLFFTTIQEADAFLIKCNNGTIPSNISNLQVAKIGVDKNGYYKVGTEYGDAYIKASKLNEELAEEVEKQDEPKKGFIENVSEFAKNLRKE